MQLSDVISLISSVGFPIVACVVLFNLYNNTITTFKDSIDNNTNVIEQLKTVIEHYFRDGDNK